MPSNRPSSGEFGAENLAAIKEANLARLLTFPNVMTAAQQGVHTVEEQGKLRSSRRTTCYGESGALPLALRDDAVIAGRGQKEVVLL